VSSVETKLATVEVGKAAERTPARGFFAGPRGWALCLVLLLAAGVGRIVSTYHVFNHTIDEPSHIACGVEWWEKGTYTIETKHTPLARISVALGPYLAGARGTGATKWQDTYPILSANGHYWRNLTLGRIGVLPFFIIGTLVVFFWTKRSFGAPAALIASAVFTLLPTILAHSAVATTDVALAAMCCWAVYAFTLWLRQPTFRTGAHFGVATGLAICTKLSALVFLPACTVPIFMTFLIARERNWRALVRSFAVAVLCALFVMWGVYRFSYAPVNRVTTAPDRVAAKLFGRSSHMTGFVRQVTARVPLPAPELFDGLRFLRHQNQAGSRGYLFGHIKEGGWWYFFFVAVALKTPIPVLLLATIGFAFSVARYLNGRVDWECAAPAISAVMIMLVTTLSRLDSGVRYVMPIFVFLSILAGAGFWALWTRTDRRLVYRGAALVLGAWMVVSSLSAHPDYLAYFNEFGGSDPSRLIVIGDYDWGQDLTRLSKYAHENSIDHMTIAYDGFFDPDSLDLSGSQRLPCTNTPSSEWVAIELRRLRVYPECFPWLGNRHPVARVGKTMLMYKMD
jgi:hypothetical protein